MRRLVEKTDPIHGSFDHKLDDSVPVVNRRATMSECFDSTLLLASRNAGSG